MITEKIITSLTVRTFYWFLTKSAAKYFLGNLSLYYLCVGLTIYHVAETACACVC